MVLEAEANKEDRRSTILKSVAKEEFVNLKWLALSHNPTCHNIWDCCDLKKQVEAMSTVTHSN